MTKTQIRIIFTDDLESLWDIYLLDNVYPYRIRVWDLIWENNKGRWRVGDEMDEMDEQKILEAPAPFKSVLERIIGRANGL
jgi:hypothetical protein